MSPPGSVPFIDPGTAGGHARVVGGLTALERVIRKLGATGARQVEVPGEPVDVARGGRPHGVEVVWLPPGSQPADGQTVVPGDTVAGVRIVDDRSRRQAEWALLRSLPKSFQGATDALLNWRFSLRITRVLARTPVTPNQVTLFATALGLVAWALLLAGSWTGIAVAGVLLQVHSILDSCDGELARLRFQFSKLGEWLDNVTDEIIDDGFAICAGIAAGGPWFWLGLLGGSRALAVGYQLQHTYRNTRSGHAYGFRYWFEGADATPDEVYDRRTVLYWVRALGRRDTYVLLWMFLCLANLPEAVAAYAAALGALTVGLTVVHVIVAPRRR